MIMDIDGKTYLTVLANAFGKHYRESTDEWSRDQEMRSFPAFIQGQLKLPGTARALDIGCGAGADVEYFSQIYGHVVGVDFYPHDDWTTISRRQSNIQFVCCGFLEYSCESSFDLVFDNGCFHHQHPEHYKIYLDKVGSIMNVNCCFVLSTFKNPEIREYVDQNGRLHRYFTDGELREILGASGFRVFKEFDAYRAMKGDYYRLSFCRR